MPSLSRPPAITDPRFMDWLNDFVRAFKALQATGTTTATTGVITVPNGGTGAQTLSGYVKGNGTNMFTAVTQVPWSDISGAPTFRVYGANVDALDTTSSTGIYAVTALGTSSVRTMTGTAARLSITDGDGVSGNPTFNIDTSYVGQASITTLGTIATGTWQATSIATTYTDAKIKTVTGTANRLTIGGTSTDPTFDVSTAYAGQNTIVTLGTITTGTWTATSIGTAYTDAKVVSISGTAGRTTISGTAIVPIVDISASYAGQNTITTLGTVTTGDWNAGAVTSTAFNGPLGTVTPAAVTGTAISGTSATITSGANSRAVNNPLLKRDTVDATITELTTDGAAGSGATNRIPVPTDAAMSVVLNICGKQLGTGDAVQFLRQFVITNNGGTTALVGSVLTLGTDITSAGLATTSCTISANNTDDCIKVEVRGIAATDIHWNCFVTAVEVIYV